MRKLLTSLVAVAGLGLMAATAPALADHQDNPYAGAPQYQNKQYGNDDYDSRWNNRDRRFDRRFDFNRHERNFDVWERGWGNGGYHQFRHHQQLSYWRLIRRIEAQGYHGVRGLRQSRFGWGYRAFAFNYRGQPVMLRINPYTGRVLNVRFLYAAY